jgi:ABC-type multidrug transport system fused ATPase/permease subunit
VTTQQDRLNLLEHQIDRLQRHLDELDRRSNRLSWLRFAIFFPGLALCVAVFFLVGWPYALGLLIVVIVAFSVAAYYHRKVERSITRHTIWRQIKAAHMARMRLDWEHMPVVNEPPTQSDHPFEVDLDITGDRSVHRLVNTAISYEGCQRVGAWLLNTASDLAAIQRRQALVRELAPMTRFRDRLTLKATLAASIVNGQQTGKRLIEWLQQTPFPASTLRATLLLSSLLSIFTLALIVLNIIGLLPFQYWVIAVLLSLGWFFATNKQRGDLFDDSFFLRDAFARYTGLFAYLETYPYGSHERVKKLCEPFFRTGKERPTLLAKRLSRIASATTLEKNGLLRLVVNVFIPWDAYIAYRLHQEKTLAAKLLPAWLETWFELEALCSFANFAYLNPGNTFPEVVPVSEQQPMFIEAAGLGHPLIPFEQRIVNDITMRDPGEVMIITGSNMSGKSTFLRTLGVNLSLAYAGGPVSAASLHVSLFRIFTCIKVSDSVTDGFSYFYAEVRRLKALLSALEQDTDKPLFFLIDEIFRGTNNRERQIGSRAYIEALVGQNCMGALSTHDLELIKLAETLSHVVNYHFREEVIDGRMVFGYKLRPGPSPTTNALEIMRLEGLPVPRGS